jgi:hypothetical protein
VRALFASQLRDPKDVGSGGTEWLAGKQDARRELQSRENAASPGRKCSKLVGGGPRRLLPAPDKVAHRTEPGLGGIDLQCSAAFRIINFGHDFVRAMRLEDEVVIVSPLRNILVDCSHGTEIKRRTGHRIHRCGLNVPSHSGSMTVGIDPGGLVQPRRRAVIRKIEVGVIGKAKTGANATTKPNTDNQYHYCKSRLTTMRRIGFF